MIRNGISKRWEAGDVPRYPTAPVGCGPWPQTAPYGPAYCGCPPCEQKTECGHPLRSAGTWHVGQSSSVLVERHVTWESRQALCGHAHDGLLSRHKATTRTELPRMPYPPCIILPVTIVAAATVQPQSGQRCTPTRRVMTRRLNNLDWLQQLLSWQTLF